MEQDLSRKYRPTTWEDVVGQDAVVKSLRGILKQKTKRSFLFIGPSGIGKTTLARIVANAVGCSKQNLLEIDAATHTGIDAMRLINETLPYKGFGESATKVVVIDECHSLSKQAWQSLLKSVEEPPEHVYWIFCTTEPNKVPVTINTRCAMFQLQPVKTDLIVDLLLRVVESEGYKTPENILALIARQSNGSPRQALSYLSQCYGCRDSKSASMLLRRVDEEGDNIDFVKAIIKGKTKWADIIKLLGPLREMNPESIRLVTLAYLTKVALGSKSDQQAGRALEIMDCFSEPYNSSEGFAPLLLSIGRLIFDD